MLVRPDTNDEPAAASATLLSLVGRWLGRGKVRLPTLAPHDYKEEIRFAVRSSASLEYWQRAIDPIDGSLLHAEVGVWRVTPAGLLEISVAFPGATEVAEGTIDERSIRLLSTVVGRAATSLRFAGSARRYDLRENAIAYEIELATVSYPLAGHLIGEVRREV